MGIVHIGEAFGGIIGYEFYDYHIQSLELKQLRESALRLEENGVFITEKILQKINMYQFFSVIDS